MAGACWHPGAPDVHVVNFMGGLGGSMKASADFCVVRLPGRPSLMASRMRPGGRPEKQKNVFR